MKTDFGGLPIKSYNPITLNFHEWADIVDDIKNSKSLEEAYAMLFTRPSELETVKKKFKEKEKVKA